MLKELMTSPGTARVIIYLLLTVFAMIPGVVVDQEARTIMIDIDTALLSIGVAVSGGLGIFAIWGKK